MSQPFDRNEEAQLYEELGVSVLPEATQEPTDADVRPNPANSIVVQVPDINSIEFDDKLIEHLDVSDPQQRVEASRVLFAAYGAAALGIPKGTHRSNWNALVHQRISLFLGRRKAAAAQAGQDTLARKVSQASAEKVADTAAISTQAALKVLKDQILGDNGEIDLTRFAQLLKEA
jgi:hypothetical protein